MQRTLLLIALLGCTKKPAAPPEATCSQVTSCIRACPPNAEATALADCTAACAAPLSPAARPYFDALQACTKPACGNACRDPSALSCKLCAMSNCASQIGDCLSH